LINSSHKPEVVVNGKKVLMFASNNYLGLLNDDRVISAAIDGVKKWGIGSGSARLFTGNLDIHVKLEKDISDFKKREAGITFVTGWMANTGSIPAIAGITDNRFFSILMGTLDKDLQRTVIFSDEFNHASIITGCQLSKVDKVIFKHNDMDDLKSKIENFPKKVRKLIIVDGVYSMDGDIAPLDKILSLAKDNNAMVYLDDAHATGVLGKNGRGTEEYFGVEGKTDIIMGTFTKVFGGIGGFIVGDQTLIDFLRITARTYIFSCPIPPPVVCGLIKSIELVRNEPQRRVSLLENASYLRSELVNRGFDICGSQTQIIPVLVGDENKSIKASEALFENGVIAPNARWPAVAKGKARLRFTVMSSHTKEQIDYLLSVLEKIRSKVKF